MSVNFFGGMIMKKCICFIIILLLVSLCGCAEKEILSNDIYTIRETNDGECVMSFHKQLAYPNKGLQASEIPPKFIFDSLGDMKRTIEEGAFNETSQKNIQKFFGNNSTEVAICNINALSDAKLPESCTSNTVHWYGSTYSIDVGDGEIYGNVKVTTKALVDWEEESWGNRTASNTAISIVSEGTDPARNAAVIVFDAVTVGERWKEIRYNYTSGDTSMVILERYLCSESETVPQAAYLWGQSNGEYFIVYLYGFTERPSYEWITSFGLKPYVETETE